MRSIFIGILVITSVMLIIGVIVGIIEPVDYDEDEWESEDEYLDYLDFFTIIQKIALVIRYVCILIMIWTLAIYFLVIHRGIPAKVDLDTLELFEETERAAVMEAAQLGIKVDLALVIVKCLEVGLNKMQIADYYKISLADVNAAVALHRERMEELVTQRDLDDL
jgi:hypothetical protein